jgi:hypothetical protein
VARESLYGALYYQRRSPHLDVDTLFPAIWNVWNKDTGSHTFVLGPLAHRTAPFEHDNWFAPLFFEGSRKDGGYFHAPLFLTSTHSSEHGAFTWSFLYYRDRTEKQIDWGVVPFVLHGDNGDNEGARKTYTLVPPLLLYHGESENDESRTTVVGPVISTYTPKRTVFDVAPLFFHIEGNPATGGVQESHTTLFPFFHYGKSPDQTLFVLPGYLRRVTKTADTMLTPFVTLASTRNGSTNLVAAGPILPLYFHYFDRDIDLKTLYVAPFYLHSSSPESSTYLTPLGGRFETYGISRTWWIFPTFTTSTDRHGWATNFYPILFTGRTDKSSHAVFAPLLWDFKTPEKRTSIFAPLFWRFHDYNDLSTTQIAVNTLYLQKKVEGGLDWQFHFLPLFSYGEDPQGYFWNVLFGLAGFQREGSFARIRALWIPITVQGSASQLAEGTAPLRF